MIKTFDNSGITLDTDAEETNFIVINADSLWRMSVVPEDHIGASGKGGLCDGGLVIGDFSRDEMQAPMN